MSIVLTLELDWISSVVKLLVSPAINLPIMPRLFTANSIGIAIGVVIALAATLNAPSIVSCIICGTLDIAFCTKPKLFTIIFLVSSLSPLVILFINVLTGP